MSIYNDDFVRFVSEHIGDDPMKLRLKYGGEQPQWLRTASNHIDCVSRAGRKFVYEGTDYTPDVFPTRLSMEQASSAAVAVFNASLVPEGLKVLDMTCGLGMDAAMLARRGCHVTTVELNPEHAAAARHNLARFADVEVVEGDSVEYLVHSTDNYDVIFIDPARRDDVGDRTYNLHHCQPDILDIMSLIAQRAPRMVAKLSPMLDVTATLNDLPGCTNLYVVEDAGECKELLVDVLTRQNRPSEAIVTIVCRHPFSFTREEELSAQPIIGMPAVSDFLYEPSAAAMKAAPFNLLCQRFGLKVISSNTHIYSAASEAAEFPGTGYRVVDVLPYSSSVIKRFARNYPSVCEVAARNFGFSAETLRAKLRVASKTAVPQSEDAPRRVIGVTSNDGQRYLLLLSRL